MPKVSLTKPGTGSTQWGTNVGQNWTDIEDTFKGSLYQREVFELTHDFLAPPTHEPLYPTVSGTGTAANVMVTGETSHVGIVQIETGTQASGRAALQTALDCILLGGGAAVFEADVRVPTLPVAAQAFAFRIGFGDSVSADHTDGVYFELTSANADWRCKTASNSNRTDTGSGENAQANTWTRLRIEINAGGTEAKFYVDGTLKQTLTTNIPTGAGRETGIVASIIKSNGTTERTAHIDYIYARIEFTTAR
jgi:hypothetical protein